MCHSVAEEYNRGNLFPCQNVLTFFAGRRGRKMGWKSCRCPRQETQKDERGSRRPGKGSQLSWTTFKLCHDSEKFGRKITGETFLLTIITLQLIGHLNCEAILFEDLNFLCISIMLPSFNISLMYLRNFTLSQIGYWALNNSLVWYS